MRRLVLFAVLSLLALASACSQASAAEPDASAMVTIVVARRALPVGSVVTFDDLQQRSVPASLVSSSVLKPDSATYIVNQKLILPLLAGDPVQWSFFESSPNKALDSCAKLEGEDASAEQQVARARQLVFSRGR